MILGNPILYIYLCFWYSFKEISKKSVFLVASKERTQYTPDSSWLSAFKGLAMKFPVL